VPHLVLDSRCCVHKANQAAQRYFRVQEHSHIRSIIPSWSFGHLGEEVVPTHLKIEAIVRGRMGEKTKELTLILSDIVYLGEKYLIVAITDIQKQFPEFSIPSPKRKRDALEEMVDLLGNRMGNHLHQLDGLLSHKTVDSMESTASPQTVLAKLIDDYVRFRELFHRDRGLGVFRSPSLSHDENEKQFAHRNILVVDDDGCCRKILTRMLSLKGFTTKESENGADAISQCRESHFDAVFLDINMPGLDGRQVCQRIRSLLSREIYVVAASADPIEESEIGPENFNYVLQKPFRPAKLHEILDQMWPVVEEPT
jgi:CheY-like chemotaxis protein